jgi:exopolyphosphatase/guanosine-5'-triphosphate,3'-diphosphate pyrophosphatase
MRVAVIDLGTNTFNLLVRDTADHEEIHAMKMPVKLGEGGFDKKEISDAAMQRGIDALQRYRKIIDSLDVDQIYAFGTSALRDANNRQVFLDRVNDTCGLSVNVISGDEEADLIYTGVCFGLDLASGRHLIMDIGGGSTEFIITHREEKLWSYSFQIGSSRLSDRFEVSDPMTSSEIDEISKYLEEELKVLWELTGRYPVESLIGSSGSFETLAQVALSKRGHPHESPANGFNVEPPEFNTVLNYVLKSTLRERLDDEAILNMRADMIVYAAVFLKLVVKRLNLNQITLSNFALKEGVFSKLMDNKLTWQRS